MLFIPPLEIASKIMTLIQDAEKHLIIVSPYVDLKNWEKMVKCLERTKNRGVNIIFYARKNAKQDFSILNKIGIRPILIDDLHAKLYINDKYAIVTSLNLLHYSDINSIDIAYSTDTEKERQELVTFVDKYLSGATNPVRKNKISEIVTDKEIFFNEYQVDKLYVAFTNKFWNAEINKTSTYIFCSGELPFADIMADSRLTIRIAKSRTDINEIIEYLGFLDYQNYHDFNIELNVKMKNSYVYIDFVPTRQIELQKLIHDYISTIETIKKSDISKVLKRQPTAW